MDDKPVSAEPVKKPHRRWFQFKLRTLLIGMALLAIPLGYVAHETMIVRERNAMLKLIVDRGGQVCYGANGPPILRRLLGEKGGDCSIVYPRSLSSAQKARISELFPWPDNWVGADLTHGE